MSRAPYQVLVIPYIRQADQILYAVFKRSDEKFWQFIAGGGEEGETVVESALRETSEEAGIKSYLNFNRLDTIASIPKIGFPDNHQWSKSICVIPEYSFALEVADQTITLSAEHLEYRWCTYEEVYSLLKWDSNRTALWELNHKLLNGIEL